MRRWVLVAGLNWGLFEPFNPSFLDPLLDDRDCAVRYKADSPSPNQIPDVVPARQESSDSYLCTIVGQCLNSYLVLRDSSPASTAQRRSGGFVLRVRNTKQSGSGAPTGL